jgi:hypothetical protein
VGYVWDLCLYVGYQAGGGWGVINTVQRSIVININTVKEGYTKILTNLYLTIHIFCMQIFKKDGRLSSS